MNIPRVEGQCDPRFRMVREAFAANFAGRGEHGAAVAVMIGGRMVVDLWAGATDRAGLQPWQHNTIVNVFSATKGLVALALHQLADRGLVEIDAPVTRYWPEFGKLGKSTITVRDILSHRAGLPIIERRLTPSDIYSWSTMVLALEEQRPLWEPGTRHGYHPLTFGWLVGEIIRRVTATRFGQYIRDNVAGPLGLEFFVGLTPGEEARAAEVLGSRPPPPGVFNLFAEIARDPDSLTAQAFGNPPSLMRSTTINSHDWRAAEIPAANGHSDARSLARLYGILAQGGESGRRRALSRESTLMCAIEQSYGDDPVLLVPTRFSLGFMMPTPNAPYGPNKNAFGHPGAGGSLGFADPAAQLGFGYVMNRMGPYILVDPRASALIDAVYQSL
jgi:CubicO group peptidase (beta-lactamase class C family)